MGAPSVPDVAPDNGPTVDNIPITRDHSELIPLVTPSPLKIVPDVDASPADQVNDFVPPHDHRSPAGTQSTIAPLFPLKTSSSSALVNPIVLKATTEDSFGPRNPLLSGPLPESMGSQVSLLEGDDMPALTDASEDDAREKSLVGQSRSYVLRSNCFSIIYRT
jgi:hypothetical protein